MPKLDLTQIAERLKARLDDLKTNKEVAAREIRALLNDEQLVAMDKAWEEQQALRKKRRAKSKGEEKELGWKCKRQIFIEAYESALAQAENQQVNAWRKRKREADVRQTRIYLESYGKAIDEGKDSQTAKNIANNDLTRAGLRRFDGKTRNYLRKRDKEINEIEATLKKHLGIEKK